MSNRSCSYGVRSRMDRTIARRCRISRVDTRYHFISFFTYTLNIVRIFLVHANNEDLLELQLSCNCHLKPQTPKASSKAYDIVKKLTYLFVGSIYKLLISYLVYAIASNFISIDFSHSYEEYSYFATLYKACDKNML